MKTARYILPVLLVTSTLCSAVWAQERSATGARDVQTSWTALKTVMSSTNAQVTAAGLKITDLTNRMNGFDTRLNKIDSDILALNGRVDVADATIWNLRNQINALADTYETLSQQVTEQGYVVNRVVNCSGKEKFFVQSGSYQWQGKCGGETVNDPGKTKKTKTFSVGNDCGSIGCVSTSATAKKICVANNYEGVQGTPSAVTRRDDCGGAGLSGKAWNPNKSQWDLVTVFQIRFGNNGCNGNVADLSFITSVTCYKYE